MSNGIKSGSADDPFAEGGDDEEDPEDNETASDPVEERGSEADPRLTDRDSESGAASTTGDAVSDTAESGSGRKQTLEDLPYLARRNARGVSVNADRTETRLVELREEIAALETTGTERVEELLGVEDVPAGDVREALWAVFGTDEACQRAVAEQLEEWGAGYFEK